MSHLCLRSKALFIRESLAWVLSFIFLLHSTLAWYKSEGSQLLPWQEGLQETLLKRTAWFQETTTLQKSKGPGVQGKYVYLFLWHLTCLLLFAETGTAETKCWRGAETMKWEFHSLQYCMNGRHSSLYLFSPELLRTLTSVALCTWQFFIQPGVSLYHPFVGCCQTSKLRTQISFPGTLPAISTQKANSTSAMPPH